MEDYFYTKTHKYFFLDNNIFVSETLPNIEFTLKDFEKNNEYRSDLIGQNQVCFLVDIRKMKNINYETREAARKEADSGRYLAIALLVGNSISKLIAGIALGFNKPKVPIKIFNNEEKAISWLNEYEISDEKRQKYA